MSDVFICAHTHFLRSSVPVKNIKALIKITTLQTPNTATSEMIAGITGHVCGDTTHIQLADMRSISLWSYTSV